MKKIKLKKKPYSDIFFFNEYEKKSFDFELVLSLQVFLTSEYNP